MTETHVGQIRIWKYCEIDKDKLYIDNVELFFFKIYPPIKLEEQVRTTLDFNIVEELIKNNLTYFIQIIDVWTAKVFLTNIYKASFLFNHR